MFSIIENYMPQQNVYSLKNFSFLGVVDEKLFAGENLKTLIFHMIHPS